MKWIWHRRTGTRRSGNPTRRHARPGRAEIAAELSRRAVPPASCDVLATALLRRMAALPEPSRACLLDGVALAFEFQEGTQLQLLHKIQEIQEVEKMMGAFSGELSKLDEVLEVLATYVRRMRSSGSAEADRILH